MLYKPVIRQEGDLRYQDESRCFNDVGKFSVGHRASYHIYCNLAVASVSSPLVLALMTPRD